ncbi:MAG: HAMP domain-containing sensor histidine kinase [bacterium]|nr:HAMP domain-containing sensor histidine kinase [bacterium]
MKNKKLVQILLILYVCFGMFFLLRIKSDEIYEPDMADINDVVQSVKESGITSDVVKEKMDKYGVKVFDQDGAIVVYSDTKSKLSMIKKTIGITFFVLMTVLLLLNIGYVLYLERTLLHPFNELKVFARHVAAGNLDLPLKKDRGNAFGEFTESFDLMREELAKAKENERKLNESKKELIASLSHDIKTPLASIKAMAELLTVACKEEKQRTKLVAISDKVDHIQVLVNNLLHSTLEELKEIKVETEECMSTQLVKMIKEADDRGLVSAISIEDSLVYCDQIRMQQVFDNIISNSYKYANTRIEVESYVEDGYLQIEVRDYGSGVSDMERLLVVKKYYRGKNGEGKSGAGIGLYISQYFMQKMQGDLEILPSKQGFVVGLKLKLV